MNELKTYSAKVSKEKTYNYLEGNGFEIRFGVTNTSNYNIVKPEDHLFELRIRHNDSEQIEALLDKIKEWVVD